ncbi:hypothetical protein TBKG_02848 [Mycobacterium tuberculosis '98-R604 INH-RIF-EM']|nr:hypothetical protein TBKG_02848 [Mycobacterium tuberculosis '98-R604 INH-RIF-EM']
MSRRAIHSGRAAPRRSGNSHLVLRNRVPSSKDSPRRRPHHEFMTESIGEPLSTNLIERYLRARGRRYFRGHHDAEFFFVANAHLRLHVHLEISPAYRDVFTIRVSPAYFFPATDHTRVGGDRQRVEPAEPRGHRDRARVL